MESAGAAGGPVAGRNPGVNGLKSLGEGLARPGQVVSPTYCGAVTGEDAPESSAMSAAQGAQGSHGTQGCSTGTPGCAWQEERVHEEQITSTSQDAKLAMLLVAEEAQEKGIDREVAL